MREVLGEELSARNFVADAIQAPWSGSRPFRERSHLAKMGRIYEAAVVPEAGAKHSPLAWSALGAAQHWLPASRGLWHGLCIHSHRCGGGRPHHVTLKAGHRRGVAEQEGGLPES